MNGIQKYADAIMEMVADDMAADEAVRAANCFSDLHSYLDANEYMIHADVPYDPDDAAVMEFYVAVQDEVTRRLPGARVYAYATAVMRLVSEDMAKDPAMRAARSFSDLERYADANDYLERADVPWEPEDEDVTKLNVAVQDEVTRRLAEGAS